MSRLFADFRHGLRLVRKAPGASLLAMLALGLGIGANTAIFSVANGILLHPLPYAHADRLMYLSEVPPHQPPTSENPLSGYTLANWTRQARSFSALAAYRYARMNLSGAGMPAMVQGAQVSANFFQVLPARVLRGRTFLAGEDQPGREREVVLGRALWEHQFAADPGLVGRAIQLDQKAYTVVGIVGNDAVQPQSAELWVPLALTPDQIADRASHYLHAIGLLGPGATQASAQSELSALAARAAAAYPDTNRGWGAYVEPLGQRAMGGKDVPSYLFLLMGAVGFLLLIACANVANLQFARALGRSHELAIRTALGAGRARLIRQLLGENVVLGLGGALVGTLFAAISLRLILSNMPADVAVFVGGWDRIRLDGTALAFTLAIALLAGTLAGLAPAWHASRPDLNSTLKESGRGAIGHARRRLRAALVVLQIALALVLLIGAGLMVQGFNAMLGGGQGYDPAHILTASVLLPAQEYATPAAQSQFTDRVLERAAALPGVAGAATGSFLPLGNNLDFTQFTVQGQPPPSDASQVQYAVPQSVSANFLPLLHVPVLYGRGFAAADGATSQPVALVSAGLAHRYWPNGDALGHALRMGSDASAPWLTVVGVVADVKWNWGDANPEYTVYQLADQFPTAAPLLLLRSPSSDQGDVTRFGPALRQAVLAVDRNRPLSRVESLAEVIHESSIGIAYVAVMMTVAAALALCLAAIGVYGVMALLVGERAREFGIRRALGASGAALVALVLRRGAAMLAWGLLFGLPVAFFLARALQSLIRGVSAGDLATYAAISLLLAAMVAIACYIPARRAARVDPLVALRE